MQLPWAQVPRTFELGELLSYWSTTFSICESQNTAEYSAWSESVGRGRGTSGSLTTTVRSRPITGRSSTWKMQIFHTFNNILYFATHTAVFRNTFCVLVAISGLAFLLPVENRQLKWSTHQWHPARRSDTGVLTSVTGILTRAIPHHRVDPATLTPAMAPPHHPQGRPKWLCSMSLPISDM